MQTDYKNWLTCPRCGKPLNSWLRGNVRGIYFNKKLDKRQLKYFCTEECYRLYRQDFVVEVYIDNPIYRVFIEGENRYLPYFEAQYYFKNIEACKQRMDAGHTAYLAPGSAKVTK